VRRSGLCKIYYSAILSENLNDLHFSRGTAGATPNLFLHLRFADNKVFDPTQFTYNFSEPLHSDVS
jgi:hypothetical protein